MFKFMIFKGKAFWIKLPYEGRGDISFIAWGTILMKYIKISSFRNVRSTDLENEQQCQSQV
jgi:hypothetical protein